MRLLLVHLNRILKDAGGPTPVSVKNIRFVCPSVCPSYWDKQKHPLQVLVTKGLAKGVIFKAERTGFSECLSVAVNQSQQDYMVQRLSSSIYLAYFT